MRQEIVCVLRRSHRAGVLCRLTVTDCNCVSVSARKSFSNPCLCVPGLGVTAPLALFDKGERHAGIFSCLHLCSQAPFVCAKGCCTCPFCVAHFWHLFISLWQRLRLVKLHEDCDLTRIRLLLQIGIMVTLLYQESPKSISGLFRDSQPKGFRLWHGCIFRSLNAVDSRC